MGIRVVRTVDNAFSVQSLSRQKQNRQKVYGVCIFAFGLRQQVVLVLNLIGSVCEYNFFETG